MEDKRILVDNISLEYLSTLKEITIADSFVKRENKVGKGNGEAKLYVGADCSLTWDFFGGPSFEISCFILKKDLSILLSSSKQEYFNPSQNYLNKDNLLNFWARREHIVTYLSEVLWFEAYEQSQIKGTRVYLKSNGSYFGLIRELCFPNITALDIHKYRNHLGHYFYNFRPYLK
jgi:hypothetical protein